MASPIDGPDQIDPHAESESEAAFTSHSRVYSALHAIARSRMIGERGPNLLQTTALVHEAFLRLRDEDGQLLDNEADEKAFYFSAARAMRHILIDEARKRRAQKRGGDGRRITLDTGRLITDAEPDHLELHEALERLEKHDPRAGRVVELRFFGGRTMPEIAELLDVSLRTVEKDWAFARAWLRRELATDSE